MRVRVLGSAAGGGFPQWNCSCTGCRAARAGAATARTQSSIAVEAGGRWFLVNASPDVRQQMTACPGLHPRDGRATPLEAVLLTDAEIDHTLGLLLLREGRGVTVHATPATEATLRRGTGFLTTLERYCPVRVVPVEPGVEVALSDELTYTAVDLPTGKEPRFAEVGSADDPGRVVGYRFTDRSTGGSVVYAPGVADVVPALLDACEGASALLVDGTAYADDELVTQGLGTKTAGDMGHLALAGPGGLLERVAGRAARTVLVHLNNSNPVLLEDSPERAAVERAGVEIGTDLLEILA
ncbi:pyrroloquinoline quinone biosynthesis protein PqqB [Actinomycetospora sp. TBRC 11914]|uniref:pyrroloquinoline quinone biosynthesis protein PqqB n=1 Tax=Actinomycetospora sp. TBRC 11914 TaxID=2729387 RepID=UPI00145EDCA8|nr:pyrroloquinoline quinone biosynthesis protein PqqB [Actinomycetospora sp. TBRC 11914]NMO90651.1 pyrroloquinoline quinone biosynthesis protein PqqB [Actinomycetospora sp. TBRC 11914]